MKHIHIFIAALLLAPLAVLAANGLKTGEIGFPYLLRALANSGRSDVIFAMINQTDKPGYGFQLNYGGIRDRHKGTVIHPDRLNPFGAVWTQLCQQASTPADHAWMPEVASYTKKVLANCNSPASACCDPSASSDK